MWGAGLSATIFGVIALASVVGWTATVWSADFLRSQEAAAHVGETATVCGVVASTNYAVRSKGQPTYLNLVRPYPNQIFTVLIWGSDCPKFGAPEAVLMGKSICATGTIKEYRGKPEIIATDPKQITKP